MSPALQTTLYPWGLQSIVTLEGPWCSGLGAEPRVGPGYMRHLDMMTKGPSNISSGLTASASVSLSPEFIQQEPPSQAAHKPQSQEQEYKGSQQRGVLTHPLSSLQLSPDCCLWLGPRVDQRHVSLPWTRDIMPTLCCVEQERFSSSNQHRADTQAKGLGIITLNKEHGRGSYVAPGAHRSLESPRHFHKTPCNCISFRK